MKSLQCNNALGRDRFTDEEEDKEDDGNLGIWIYNFFPSKLCGTTLRGILILSTWCQIDN